MQAKFIGVPFAVWGILWLIVALIWVFVWPADKAAALSGARFLILRWGHALVWLLLAIAAFVTGFDVLGGARLGQPVALASLIVYLAFMFTMITTPAP